MQDAYDSESDGYLTFGSLDAAAAHLGVAKDTVAVMCRDGRLEGTLSDGRWTIRAPRDPDKVPRRRKRRHGEVTYPLARDPRDVEIDQLRSEVAFLRSELESRRGERLALFELAERVARELAAPPPPPPTPWWRRRFW